MPQVVETSSTTLIVNDEINIIKYLGIEGVRVVVSEPKFSIHYDLHGVYEFY